MWVSDPIPDKTELCRNYQEEGAFLPVASDSFPTPSAPILAMPKAKNIWVLSIAKLLHFSMASLLFWFYALLKES